jgi:putative flavoprotein involved in K+ transport
MAEHVEVIIIGGGHAGLALSYYLTQQRQTHLVLEQGQVGETWRTKRWDSFTLVTPNWMTQLPGFGYQGDDPDGFLPREDFVNYLEQYAQSFRAPLLSGVRVTAVRQQPGGDGYLVETDKMTFETPVVVLATGAYPKPKIPAGSVSLPADIKQIHSSDYRNPDALPPGAVLVVGTGQSGFQIAEELHESGRQVYLSMSGCARVPLRYRGKHVIWWLTRMGFFDRTVDQLPSPYAKFACSPHVSNKYGERDISLRQLGERGLCLLGRVQSVRGQEIAFAPDLEENLVKAEAFATQVTQMIDGFIMKTGMAVPANNTNGTPQSTIAQIDAEPILSLDLASADICSIVWATGYKLDFSWVQVPVFDETGYPIHQRGVTAYPGLYFLGLHWLYKMKSALIYGIGEDAAYIASAIAAGKS